MRNWAKKVRDWARNRNEKRCEIGQKWCEIGQEKGAKLDNKFIPKKRCEIGQKRCEIGSSSMSEVLLDLLLTHIVFPFRSVMEAFDGYSSRLKKQQTD